MPPPRPRTNTPAVEPNQTSDVTQREAAPLMRPTPVPDPPSGARKLSKLPPPPAVRSRKETLVSPIPALLAASMTDVGEENPEAAPAPVAVGGDATSRFEVADHQRALAMVDEGEYVVELDDGVPKSTT